MPYDDDDYSPKTEIKNATIEYTHNDQTNEIHIDSNGIGHAHDNVDETRNGNASWDDDHRPLTDYEREIVSEVAEQGEYESSDD